jgi:hypothetical protein
MTSTLGSWLRIPKSGSAIGVIGPSSSSPSITWTPCSPGPQQDETFQLEQEPSSLEHSLDGSGLASTPKTAMASEPKRFRSCYVPSVRHSNWLENQT